MESNKQDVWLCPGNMTRVVELASSDWLSGLFVYRRNRRRNYYRIKRRLSAVQTVFHNRNCYRVINSSVYCALLAEANPEKFNSRFRNKMFYAGVSVKQLADFYLFVLTYAYYWYSSSIISVYIAVTVCLIRMVVVVCRREVEICSNVVGKT